MKQKTKTKRRVRYPAGTKLYRKALKSQYGHRGYKPYFDVRPIFVTGD